MPYIEMLSTEEEKAEQKKRGRYLRTRDEKKAEGELCRLAAAAFFLVLTFVMVKSGHWSEEKVREAIAGDADYSYAVEEGKNIKETAEEIFRGFAEKLRG